MSEFMRAVDVKNGAGPASAMFINEHTPVPTLKSGECLVKVKAFGINRGDILQRDGKYPGIAHLTKTMGLEFSGIIARLGDNQSDEWKVGDEVFGLLYGGGYGEYVNVHRRMLIRKPKELSFEQTGGLCEAWFTAMQALHFVGQYQASNTRSILWHAGASAVLNSPKVFGTARKQDKCAFVVNQLGATGVVDLTQHPDKRSWASEIKAMNGGQGVDLVIDFLGGPYLESNLDVLAIDGRIVQLGWLDGPVAENVNIAGFLTKRARVQGSQLRSRSLEYQICLRDFFEANVLPLLVDGRFQHVIERVFPWEQVREAHELLETNRTRGKVVCVIN